MNRSASNNLDYILLFPPGLSGEPAWWSSKGTGTGQNAASKTTLALWQISPSSNHIHLLRNLNSKFKIFHQHFCDFFPRDLKFFKYISLLQTKCEYVALVTFVQIRTSLWLEIFVYFSLWKIKIDSTTMVSIVYWEFSSGRSRKAVSL